MPFVKANRAKSANVGPQLFCSGNSSRLHFRIPVENRETGGAVRQVEAYGISTQS